MTHQGNSDLTILHLSLIRDIGPSTVAHLVAHKPASISFADIYQLSVQDLISYFGCTLTTAHKIVDGLKDRRAFEHELNLIERHAIAWVTIIDPVYPQLLSAIHAPPPVLYYKGVLPNSEKMIAIVGSRKADSYGNRVINTLIPTLVKRSWIIVSGGALGIDCMAHKATLETGGTTLAVLGSGLLRPSPMQNYKVFKAIEETGGAVVSSFPLEEESYPGNFPARNRIISGLSRGVVVVQAANQSGASITARFAVEQGREVFAVPGNFDDPLSVGCHALIQEGAKLITSVNDILQEFGETELPQPHKDPLREQMVIPATNTEDLSAIDDPKMKIIKACKNPCNVDELMLITGISLHELNGYLFDLQLSGCIEQDFTGKWKAP